MNIINKLTLRSLKLNKKRTIVTIIGIILSGAMICAVATIAVSFQNLLIQTTIEGEGNYHASFYNVSYDNIKYITDNTYTKTSMLSRNPGIAKSDMFKNENKPYLNIKEYDKTAFEHMPIKLVEGRIPQKKGEIIISEEILLSGSAEYQIGDVINITFGRRVDKEIVLSHNKRLSESEIFESTASEKFTITGFIAKPQFEYYSSPWFTAIAYFDTSILTNEDTVNVSILANQPKHIYTKTREIANNVGIGINDISYNDELLRWLGISDNENFNSMFISLVLIIILLIMVGSVAVIYNAFAISVSERKKQFGMLVSVGATPRQIRKTVFFEGFILGIIGVPIGVLSGIAGIGITLKVVNNLIHASNMFTFDASLTLVISPLSIVITVFFISLTIFLSALIPAKRASNTSPIDAIRLSNDIKIKGKKLKTSKLTRFFFGIAGDLALKNLKRNRRKYRATVFSLFISIVLFISFSTFLMYGIRSTDMYYGDIPFDMEVSIYDASFEDQKSFVQTIRDLQEIERYSVVRTSYYSVSDLERKNFGGFLQKNGIDNGKISTNAKGKYNFSFMLLSLGEKEYNRYLKDNDLTDNDYKDLNSYKGILINKNVIVKGKVVEYQPLNVIEGDSFNLTGNTYHDNNNLFDFNVEIGAVTDRLPFGVRYLGENAVYLIVTDEVYDSIASNINEKQRREKQRPVIYIKTQDSEKLATKIRSINASQFNNGHLSVNDITSGLKDIKRLKTIIGIFVYGFVALITLIGATNIFNTISTNIALRRREFAMLKSVGLTPKGFNKMINYESIFYGLKALIYGLPISIIISLLMYNSFSNLFSFEFVLPWNAIMICIAGVFIIVSITMLHSSAKLKKENIIDALRQENL